MLSGDRTEGGHRFTIGQRFRTYRVARESPRAQSESRAESRGATAAATNEASAEATVAGVKPTRLDLIESFSPDLSGALAASGKIGGAYVIRQL